MIQKRGLWRAFFLSHLTDRSAAAHRASAPVIRGERRKGAGDDIQADTLRAVALHRTHCKLRHVMNYPPKRPYADQARARVVMNALRLRRLST